MWEEVKLPEGKVLIPGVIAYSTPVVEHPELVVDRIVTYARLVGWEGGETGRARCCTLPHGAAQTRPGLPHTARGAFAGAGPSCVRLGNSSC